MILGIVIGIISDRVQIYKILLIVNFFILGAGALLLSDMYINNGMEISNLYYFGFTITKSIFPVEYLLAMTIMSKRVSIKTRGTMFAFCGFLGTLGVTLM